MLVVNDSTLFSFDKSCSSLYQELISKCDEEPSREQIEKVRNAYTSLQQQISKSAPFGWKFFSCLPWSSSSKKYSELSRKANSVWEQFFAKCVSCFSRPGKFPSIADSIHGLEYLRVHFPRRFVILEILGDLYAEISHHEKAVECYQKALRRSSSVRVAQELEIIYRERGEAEKGKKMRRKVNSLAKRGRVPASVRLRQLASNAANKDWKAAFEEVYRRFDDREEEPSIEFVWGLIDIYLALSSEPTNSIDLFVVNFRDVAKHAIGLLDKPSPSDSASAVLGLVDYACRRIYESERFLDWLAVTGHEFLETTDPLFKKLDEWENQIEVMLDEAEREKNELCDGLKKGPFSSKEEKLEASSRLRKLQELFRGGGKEIPVGLCRYIGQYKRSLENNDFSKWGVSECLVSFHRQRFDALGTRANALFASLQQSGSESLIESLANRTIEFSAMKSQGGASEEVAVGKKHFDTIGGLKKSTAHQNLFNYVVLNFVPPKNREEATEYLKQHKISLDVLFSSTLSNYVSNQKISSDYAELKTFLYDRGIEKLEQLRSFVYNHPHGY